MKEIVAALTRARDSGDLSELLAAVPYAAFLGLTVASVDTRYVCRMEYRASNIGNVTLPALHGGTIGALMESAALFEVAMRADTLTLPKTINLTIDYLRSGKPRDTFAVAQITRHGRRVASVQVAAFQEDAAAPIATALVHLLTEPLVS